MTGWTIITANVGLDTEEEFTEYCSAELAMETNGELEVGSVAENVYVSVRGGREYAPTARELAERCPMKCRWIAVVQNNNTDPDEHFWLYAPTDPREETDTFSTPYTEVDAYHQAVAEYFMSKEDWERGIPATTAYEYGKSVYGIEVKTRPNESDTSEVQ